MCENDPDICQLLATQTYPALIISLTINSFSIFPSGVEAEINYVQFTIPVCSWGSFVGGSSTNILSRCQT